MKQSIVYKIISLHIIVTYACFLNRANLTLVKTVFCGFNFLHQGQSSLKSFGYFGERFSSLSVTLGTVLKSFSYFGIRFSSLSVILGHGSQVFRLLLGTVLIRMNLVLHLEMINRIEGKLIQFLKKAGHNSQF